MYDLLIKFLGWLQEMLTDLIVTMLDAIQTALFIVLDSILGLCPTCTPSAAMAAIEVAISGVPASLLWFLGWFQLDYALGLIGGAYLVRFLIRRLPVIG